jgi:uncharacterized protein (TIGR00297 family)
MGILRKLIHLSMGFFALALRWLNPWQAMLCALLAFVHNVWIFPLYGRKKLEKEEEKKRGYTAIASYPAVVFVIIGLAWVKNIGNSQEALAIAAGSWAILAFGDAFGAIIGTTLKGPILPWNKGKTWTGLLGFTFFGTLAAVLIFSFVINSSLGWIIGNCNFLPFVIFVAFIAAIVESLDGQFDDNLGFPLVALSLFYVIGHQYISPSWVLLTSYLGKVLGGKEPNSWVLILLVLINISLAATALLKKWVNVWGFIFGLLIGFSVIFSLGWKGFVVLCLFYLFANFSTFYGKKTKEERGIAEGNKGTRGLESVFSKGLAPAVFAWFSFPAFVASLAFYAADTVATEFGKTSKKRTFSILSFKNVPPGTVGAISVKGTVAGLFSIAFFISISLLAYSPAYYVFTLLLLFILVMVFFILESVINELNAKFQLTSKMVIHITLGFLLSAFVSNC